jgi:hypothetical protein
MNPFLGDWILLRGTTNATANTALTTKHPNPYKSTGIYCIVLAGRGVHIPHDPSSPSTAERASGISATEIDVQSTATSQDYLIAVFPAQDKPRAGGASSA